ncbi:hypothetical protein BACCAP_04433 [Pseudoflavonifractor capillosus ATCC 29799]|uniref:Uncharacterized protein n=1 Tax=Pseudoflavonifractor capillosus ATCC 29799 TaxID=411467 RepID=A6P1R1_9FIRM|nr:hypothetical protein BACCAP_04433 [Pseudoflavonifractor capillosus ATCC 29799]
MTESVSGGGHKKDARTGTGLCGRIKGTDRGQTAVS